VSLARNTVWPLVAAVMLAAVALALAACGRDEPNLSEGKALFTERCGSCHILARAGTQGRTGPDLDAAFRVALTDGMNRDTVEGIVHSQILNPRRGSAMPAKLVEGEQAEDVAAYVGFAAARAGQDQGALAQAGLAGARTGDQIFTAAGCGACHTLSKANASGTIGPNLNELAQVAGEQGGSPEEFVRESIVDPDAVVADGFQSGVMPAFEGRLTDEQLQALVRYLLE
jgi:mono/diheme cytochrome c family protein